MKKSGWLLLGIMLIATSAMAQLAVDNFDYDAGALTVSGGANVSGGTWANISGSAAYLQVVDGSLTYPGYKSSGVGRMLQMVSTTGSGEDAAISFSSISAGTVYASFLLNVDDLTAVAANASTTGDYMAMYTTATSTTTHFARLCTRKSADGTKLQLGLRATSSNTASEWAATELNVGETYYIVIGYTLISGNTNDVASVWINPAFGSVPPTPDITQTSGLTTDPANAGKFVFRQGLTSSPSSTTPNAKVDGVRISDVWADVTLPVQLASFAAVRVSDDVQLTWSTLSEVNNFGFYVERKLDGASSFTEIPNSFVPGHQTTLEPQSYSFTDNTVAAGVWYYRLRQVDLDGKISYSEPVKVNFTTDVATGTPASYSLSQNFPNPFNPSTDIQFTLAKAGTVSLKVYDMLGREVATLANSEYAAGVHHIMFNAINLPSGAYFYALKAGNFSAMKSMLLVK